MCRSIITDMAEEARIRSDEEVSKQMVELVLEMAWETLEVDSQRGHGGED